MPFIRNETQLLNPFRTAVLFGDKTTWNLSGLSPKRDCGSKRVNAVKKGNYQVHWYDLVKTALEAGANVNGSPEQSCPPIVVATLVNHACIVNFLLDGSRGRSRQACDDGCAMLTFGY